MILQLFVAARVAAQVVLLTAKSPEAVMLLMCSVWEPVLVSVAVFGALVPPTAVLANASEEGVRVTVVPLPVTVS